MGMSHLVFLNVLVIRVFRLLSLLGIQFDLWNHVLPYFLLYQGIYDENRLITKFKLKTSRYLPWNSLVSFFSIETNTSFTKVSSWPFWTCGAGKTSWTLRNRQFKILFYKQFAFELLELREVQLCLHHPCVLFRRGNLLHLGDQAIRDHP